MQRQARLLPRLDSRACSIASARHASLKRLPWQRIFPTTMLTEKLLGKSGGNRVEGDRFFNREIEPEALQEPVRNGTRTPPTAQRPMGKSSFVREPLRQFFEQREFEDAAGAVRNPVAVRMQAGEGCHDDGRPAVTVADPCRNNQDATSSSWPPGCPISSHARKQCHLVQARAHDMSSESGQRGSYRHASLAKLP